MIPDSVHTSKPVYRKLHPRNPEELACLAKEKAKKEKNRKSLS